MIENLFTLYIQSTLPRTDTFETSTMAVLEKWLFFIESQLREVKKGREAGTNCRCSQRGVFQELSVKGEVTV